jgi:hypothetical protein
MYSSTYFSDVPKAMEARMRIEHDADVGSMQIIDSTKRQAR